jgi:tetratricopeptide (TPR) repeat protein
MAKQKKKRAVTPDKQVQRHIASGFRLFEACRYADAKKAFLRALTLSKSTNILDDIDHIRIHHLLGVCVREEGDLQGAKAHLSCAFEQAAAAYAPDDPDFVPLCYDLACVLQALGDVEVAKALYLRILDLDRAQKRTIKALCQLGAILEDAGEVTEAKAHYMQALAIAEARAPESVEMILALYRLSDILLKLGDRKGAKAAYARGLSIAKVVLKDSHPEAATHAAHLELTMHLGPVISRALH